MKMDSNNNIQVPDVMLETTPLFNKPVARKMCHPQDGVVDSLSYLVMQENFIKPYSEEHVLATLLLRAF